MSPGVSRRALLATLLAAAAAPVRAQDGYPEAPLPPAHPHIKSGALRALAVTGETRWFDLPDVPTMVEAGFPDIMSETFQGMHAPAGTPDAIVQWVAHETLAVLKEPEISDKLRGIGFDVRAAGPKGLAARVAREVPMWHDVIQQSKIELQ